MKPRILSFICFVLAALPHSAFSSPGPIPVPAGNAVPGTPVKLTADDKSVIIDNGVIQLTLSKPRGFLDGIKYKDIDNIMDRNGGYYDVAWEKPGGKGRTDKVGGTKYTVITETENQVEVSFSRQWDSSLKGKVPLNVDNRYIVQKGVSGFYWYVIVERLKGWPDVNMDQHRIVFRPLIEMFKFMAVSNNIQLIMPEYTERSSGKPLAYPEAVILNTTNPTFKGQVDDKYQYSTEMRHHSLKGWISEDKKTGFWVISPSGEYSAGGPNKPELSCHCGPIALASFTSTHYAGLDMATGYRNGEPWKKVFGPVFIYLNSNAPNSNDYAALWKDAKTQTEKEVQNWPYSFVQSPDYLPAAKRGTISGQLLVDDKVLSPTPKVGANAYVGLAMPGAEGSWQLEVKGYQFWTITDDKGNFVIKNVIPGAYNLYGWVPGVVGDFKHPYLINVQAGNEVKLGPVTYKAPRNGSTLWEIGIPDRSAAEFYVPDVDPHYVNKFFLDKPHDKYRQYGLWERYAQLYPKTDLVFEVGKSDYSKDWFFAHVLRKSGPENNRESGPKNYIPTTWQIIFDLPDVAPKGIYTLQLALASAHITNTFVYVNNLNAKKPAFATGTIGRDDAITRHGIHGIYWHFSISLPSNLFVKGKNTIFLKPSQGGNFAFSGVMYDYIRLEGPPPAA